MDAGLPASIDLETQVSQDIMNISPNGLNAGARELLVHIERDFKKQKVKPDIELLLTAVHVVGESIPTLVGLRALLQKKYRNCHDSAWRLGYIIWERVIDLLSTPSPQRLNYLEQLLSLHFNQDRPLEVFTLNYDLCLEAAFKHLKVDYATGFDHDEHDEWGAVWNPKTLEARELKVRLFKLHGSLDWKIRNLPNIILGFQEKIALIDPFWSLWNVFVRSVRDSEILVIIGYSFRDEHVNALLEEAATRGVELVIVQPDLDTVTRWASRIKEQSRITPLFLTAKEAILEKHLLHALFDIKTARSSEGKLSLFETRSGAGFEYLKNIWVFQHSHSQ